MMHIDKISWPDRRRRFITAHRRLIGQSLSDSFINTHHCALYQ
jgi:hypothetical protein